VQDNLPAHAMLAVEKPLHFHPAALRQPGDPCCQFTGGFRRDLELQLPVLPCFGLLGSVGQRNSTTANPAGV